MNCFIGGCANTPVTYLIGSNSGPVVGVTVLRVTAEFPVPKLPRQPIKAPVPLSYRKNSKNSLWSSSLD